MLKMYKRSVQFLERRSSKMRGEDPRLVQNTLSEFLKGAGNMVSSAAFAQPTDSTSSNSEVRSFCTSTHEDFLITSIFQKFTPLVDIFCLNRQTL